MRFAKYRAKALQTGNWVYGCVCKQEGAFVIQTEDEQFVPIDEETICSFTGLRDVNGKDVYQYDEVLLIGMNYTVSYFDGYYALSRDGININSLMLHNGIQMEVIGSIMDEHKK